MAGKISELGAGAAVAAADLFEALQSGVNVKLTAAQIATFVTGNIGNHALFSADNTYDIGAAAANRPRNYFGAGDITCGSGGTMKFNGRGGFSAASDGVIRLKDNAGTSFGRLQFGGTTSSFPSLKRSSAAIQCRLADDSAFAVIQGQLTTDANATTGLTAGALAATTNASIVVYDASGQAYRIPCII